MTKTIIPFIFIFFLIFNCKSQSIGDYYQGGVVFYLDSFGGGLIVDIVDIPNPNPMVNTSLDSLLSRWGNYSTHVPGTSYPSIGSGIINTQNFITFYNSGNFAVHQCVNSNNQGFNDWYLPSKDELVEMYNTIGNGGPEGNIGGFFDETFDLLYWSSSEYDIVYAWYVYFANGDTDGDAKPFSSRVRVIRAF